MQNIQTSHFSNIEYPSTILLALKKTEKSFIRELKVMAAIKFYELKKLSLGKASELAGMHKGDFIKILGKNKVSIFSLSIEELKQDIQNA